MFSIILGVELLISGNYCRLANSNNQLAVTYSNKQSLAKNAWFSGEDLFFFFFLDIAIKVAVKMPNFQAETFVFGPKE